MGGPSNIMKSFVIEAPKLIDEEADDAPDSPPIKTRGGSLNIGLFRGKTTC